MNKREVQGQSTEIRNILVLLAPGCRAAPLPHPHSPSTFCAPVSLVLVLCRAALQPHLCHAHLHTGCSCPSVLSFGVPSLCCPSKVAQVYVPLGTARSLLLGKPCLYKLTLESVEIPESPLGEMITLQS